jgi:hypothetical protein
MAARLASSVLVGGLIRQAETEGGFAAVLARGDGDAGSIIVILTQRGAEPSIHERLLQPDGSYAWSEAPAGSEAVGDFIARRRRFDPDIWVLELDVPSRQRFADEMKAFD